MVNSFRPPHIHRPYLRKCPWILWWTFTLLPVLRRGSAWLHHILQLFAELSRPRSLRFGTVYRLPTTWQVYRDQSWISLHQLQCLSCFGRVFQFVILISTSVCSNLLLCHWITRLPVLVHAGLGLTTCSSSYCFTTRKRHFLLQIDWTR
jgi:hypothetical protein